MVTGILIIALVALLGVLSHRRSRLENKIYKNVPLTEWLVVFIFPLALYLGWFFTVKSILARPQFFYLPFDDIDLLAITMLFMIFGFMGNAIHFTGKILWRYLRENNRSMAFKVNEMFHGRLSHYLVFMNGIFIVFFLSVLEINHPFVYGLSAFASSLLILTGIIAGLSMRRMIFYTNEWFGGYNKPIFFVGSGLLAVLISLFRSYKLSLSLYPVSIFIISLLSSGMATFILRQFFIFTRLNNRRRLRFLSKILSF